MSHDKTSRSVAAKRSSERLRLFQTIVYGSDGDNAIPLRQIRSMSRNLRVVRYAAVVVIITASFWLIYDFLNGGILNYSTGETLAVTLALIAASIYMLILSVRYRHVSERMIRYSFFAYYILMNIFVAVLAVNNNITQSELGVHTSISGIPISTFYLIILILAPLPPAVDSVILGVFCLIMTFVPVLAPGYEVYDLKQNILLCLCLMVAYIYVRSVNATLSESMQKLSALSYTDPLTGVLNRRSVEVYLDDLYYELCNKHIVRSAAILLLDIDDFKQYNDNYSHAEGDEVLKTMCGAVVNAIKDRGGFLFRYGGEEFVVVLIDRTDDEIVNIAAEIKTAIYNANIERNDLQPNGRVTVTVGCSQEVITGTLSQKYILQADKQLYIGKNSGKNCVVYNGKIYR